VYNVYSPIVRAATAGIVCAIRSGRKVRLSIFASIIYTQFSDTEAAAAEVVVVVVYTGHVVLFGPVAVGEVSPAAGERGCVLLLIYTIMFTYIYYARQRTRVV